MKPSRSRRIVAITIATVVVASLAGLALRPRREPVEVHAVTRGPLRVTIEGDGRTRVRERYTIAAPVSGNLSRVTVHAGDRVGENEVVARIDPVTPALLDARARSEAEARVKAATAALFRSQALLEAARAGAEFARREHDRQKQLVDHGAGTAALLDAATLERERRDHEVDSARMAMRADRFQLETARAALVGVGGRPGRDAVAVRAPLSATVLRVLRESEGPVAAGAPLLEVGDLSTLEMVVDLLSSDAVQVEVALPVMVDRWGGDAVLVGRVRRVEPSAFTKVSALGVEEQRVNVVIDFGAPAPAAGGAEALPVIGDGYQAEVRIVVWQRPSVLRVPMAALFRGGEGWAAFVVEGGAAKRREVTIGHHDGSDAEVLGGLAEGERVVLHPSDRIDDGVRVKTS